MSKSEGSTGARALVRSLAAYGVDRAFCVPGESFLAVLDALYDRRDIELVTCRHESGAGLMAVADAKLTGRPGVVLVSRGPGAANAALAVHVAEQDAVPLVLLVGQVESENLGRRAFQEVDYAKTFADMAKSVAEVRHPARLGEMVARAFALALGGTPGPVVLSLPEDVLAGPAPAEVVPLVRLPLGPDSGALEAAVRGLAQAQRPLVLAGGGTEPRPARRALLAASEKWNLPVAATNKHQAVFANDHPNWVCHVGYVVPPALAAAMRRADLVIAIGTRLGDVSSQRYRFPRAPRPEQALLHVYPDPAVIGRTFVTDIGVVADAAPFLEGLAAAAPPTPPARGSWLEDFRAERDRLARRTPVAAVDGLDFGHVVEALAATLAADAIMTMDAGGFASWAHAYFPFRSSHDLLGAVGGAMGFGVPAAVAACLRHPERQVVGLVGDGGFLMTGNELATAVQHGAKPRLFVANNDSYGSIRLRQEEAYPNRPIATDLTNPDFAMLARAYGALGLTLERADQARAVVAEALAADGPVVVDVRTGLDRVSADQARDRLAASFRRRRP
jgi:acetolactate synthase-1/2/3 large subunit